MAVNGCSRRGQRLFTVLLMAILMVPFSGGLTTVDLGSGAPPETLPMHAISLQNKQAFQASGSNWGIAGGVKSSRHQAGDLHLVEGTGVIVNMPTSDHHKNLVTRMKHGDMELELDFLMPKGANSGIYLQGRYEVQLLDSWGVHAPHFGDCGGIYQRWDASRPEGQRGYGGHPPSMNASRAPGLWQHLKIVFKAPGFDGQGHKTSNAVFKEVWLNGVLVQQNVNVTGPTRAAMFDDEQPTGPLMIQGDHGPVAIRHIRYKKYDKTRITLTNLHYDFYKGAFNHIPEGDTLQAAATGQVDSLTGAVGQEAERYFLHYTGTLDAPTPGRYFFKVRQAGMTRLAIDGREVIDQTEFYKMDQYDSGTIKLTKGKHTLELNYVNHPIRWLHGLALYGEGPQLRMQPFQAAQSVPGGGKKIPPLIVEPQNRVKAIRSFGMFGRTKRTNVMNVGSPAGINYNYDIGQGELLHIWNGPFIDAKQMWASRGESQLARPGGPVVTMDGKPLLAHLESDSQAWPDSIGWSNMHIQGYDLRDNGWPEFRYKTGSISVHDYLGGSAGNRSIIRKIQLRAPANQRGLWLHLASGKTIRKNADNEYVVDDRSYYLKLLDSGGSRPVIRKAKDGQQLLLPVLSTGAQTTVRYAVIW